jgi:4-amino-4-deoxy-L-arabinose transferase-like glycosyltransferase
MEPRTSLSAYRLALALVLVTAAVLRLVHLGDVSLTNDELSALVRTRFGSFAELLDHGVRVDAHPALTQVFLYYWVQLAGDTEFALRLPFALCGIASVWLLYRLGTLWFGRASGLAAAAALAVLQFPILYSQLARPYAPGLLFTLAAAVSWTRVLLAGEDAPGGARRRHAVALAFSLAACAYTHYFSMLTAGLMAAAGLLFLNRKNAGPYLSALLGAVVLFLPHLGIFFRQLSYGGVGAWLGVPGDDFFAAFLDYSFNSSAWLKGLFLLLFLLPLALSRKPNARPALLLLAMAFFLIPYLAGAWYSVHVNPVLQYSTLLFSFPFLLLLLTAFLSQERIGGREALAVAVIVLAAGTVSTTAGQHYYSTPHFGVFKELVTRTLGWREQYGSGKVTTVLNVTNPDYPGYYFDRYRAATEVSLYAVRSDSELAVLRDLAAGASTPYFVYGWSNVPHPPEAVALIRAVYPHRAEAAGYFNSSVALFSRNGNGPAPVFRSATGYESAAWGGEEEVRNDTVARSGRWAENLEGREFSLTFAGDFRSMTRNRDDVVSCEVFFRTTAAAGEMKLVVTFEAGGKTYDWHAVSAGPFNRQPGSWQRIVSACAVPHDMPANGTVKCYFWNPGGKPVSVDDFTVAVRPAGYYL